MTYFERLRKALEIRKDLSQREIQIDIQEAERNSQDIEFEMRDLFFRRGIL